MQSKNQIAVLDNYAATLKNELDPVVCSTPSV
jgi:hypothetical protein